MSKFTGNIIRLPAVTPTQNSASGVYTLDDQFTAQSSGTWPIVRDQYFNYTTLLLTGAVQGTAYPNPVTQPYSFLSDASTNNFVVSPNGDVSARPFNPYLNSYSNFFSGSGQYLTATNSSAFYLSTGNFTVEAWIYRTAASSGNAKIIVGQTQNTGVPYAGWLFYVTSSDFLRFEGSNGVSITASITVPLNQWVHVAAVRASSTTTIYMNGVLVSSGSVSITDFSGLLTIGQYTSAFSGPEWIGYISNLRIVKGTAVYTSSFTPPTQPLQNISGTSLLTCQSNRFIDNSTANSGSGFPITVIGSPAVSQNSPFVSYDTTNGSGYFDGNDYSEIANNAAFDLPGDFTVEAWVYCTSTVNAGNTIVGKWATAFAWAVYVNPSTGEVLFFYGNNGSFVNAVSFGTSVKPFTWVHVAVTRQGTDVKAYVNGGQVGTTQNISSNLTATSVEWIGRDDNASRYFSGYISNIRVVKGTAVYTGNFSPPSLAPLARSGAASAASYPSTTNVNTSFAESATSLLTLQTRAPATNNGFIDSSPNNFVVTRNGNTTQGSFSPFSPTGWGVYGSGTTSYAQLNNTDYALGTGDFTIEFWMYLTSDKATTCFCSPPSNPNLTVAMTGGSAGARLFYMEYGGAGTTLGAGSNYLNKWTHVAFVRSSGVVTCYQDGSPTNPGGTSKSASVGSTASLYLLRNSGDTSQDVPGYVSNFRICKSAVYTANFNPPTSALTTTSQGATNCVLLTFQSNRFRDNSNNNSTVTPSANLSVQAFSPFSPAQSYIPSQIGGSGYFDGTGSGTAADYLTVPDSPAFTLGSGDFTLETWIYSTLGSGADRYYIAHTDNATAASSQFAFYQRSADAFILFEYYVSTTSSSITSGAAITLNQWNHIAVCRSNGTLSMFVNGVRPATGTTNISTTAFNDSASSLGIGGRTSGAALLTGNISGMRLVRGTDIYGASNTTITVPTAPPTAIPNTSLLLNFTNGGIVDATGKNIIETLGNATQSTAQSKWSNSGSFLNNGAAGSRFQVSSSSAPPLFNVGSGDYTVEFWVNTGTPASQQCILDFRNADVAGQGYALIFNTSRQIIMYYNVGNRITTSAISANVWTHVAVVRYNGVYTIYVDGSASGGTYNNSDAVAPPANRPLIGSVSDGSQVFNGNFSNFRISRIARYTSNFNTNLPPGPFPLG